MQNRGCHFFGSTKGFLGETTFRDGGACSGIQKTFLGYNNFLGDSKNFLGYKKLFRRYKKFFGKQKTFWEIQKNFYWDTEAFWEIQKPFFWEIQKENVDKNPKTSR